MTSNGLGAPILAVFVIVVIVIALFAGGFVACALAAVSILFVGVLDLVVTRAAVPLALLALALLVIIAVAVLAALALLVILAVLAVLAVLALGATAGVRPRYLTLNLEIVSGNCIESK